MFNNLYLQSEENLSLCTACSLSSAMLHVKACAILWERYYVYLCAGLHICKGRKLIQCHFMLSVESSPVSHYIVWKVFTRSATKQLELNCLGLCFYSWERLKLCFWISLNLVWHLSVLTLLILAFTPGTSVCFLQPDEMYHCYFFSRFIFCKSAVQKVQNSPCRRNRVWHRSCVTAAHSVLGHFALASLAACSPCLEGGSCGHDSLPWGTLHCLPGMLLFLGVNLDYVLIYYCQCIMFSI